MRLAQYQIDRHLQAKKLAPIYLICGADPLLKQEACDSLKKTAQSLNFTEHTRFFVETNFDWEDFYQNAYSTSLFASQRLLDLDFIDGNVPQAAGEIFKKYSEALPQDTLLLIRMGKLDKKTEKTAWFQALEKNGVLITLWPPAKEALPQWITQRATQKYQLALTQDATAFLVEQSEGNLLAIAQALEKLHLLQLKNPIEKKILSAWLVDESQFTIYDFVDSLLTEDKARSLRVLSHLKKEGTEPTLLLWAIAREFRVLAELAQQLQTGSPFKALCQKSRIMERRQPMIHRFLQKYSFAHLSQMLIQAAEIDRIIKGAQPGSVWGAFEGLLYAVY